MNSLQDRIRGSLVGGAIGDALGYPVEFVYAQNGKSNVENIEELGEFRTT